MNERRKEVLLYNAIDLLEKEYNEKIIDNVEHLEDIGMTVDEYEEIQNNDYQTLRNGDVELGKVFYNLNGVFYKVLGINEDRYLLESQTEKPQYIIADTIKYSGDNSYEWDKGIYFQQDKQAAEIHFDNLKRGSAYEYLQVVLGYSAEQFSVLKEAANNDLNVYNLINNEYSFQQMKEIKDNMILARKPFYWYDPYELKESDLFSTVEAARKNAIEYITKIDLSERLINNDLDRLGAKENLYIDIVEMRFSDNFEHLESECIDNLKIDDQKYLQNSYRGVVQEKIKKEFNDYKNITLALSREEIFRESYKNHFYSELFYFINEDYDFSENGEFSTEEYYRALNNDANILSCLFDEYVSNENPSIENYGETSEFLRKYIERYYFKELIAYKRENTQNKIKADLNGTHIENMLKDYLNENNIEDDFDENQRDIIKTCLDDDLDISIIANSKFDFTQMLEIKDGLKMGIDVSKYADENLIPAEMYKRRMEILDNKKYLMLKVKDSSLIESNNTNEIMVIMPKGTNLDDSFFKVNKHAIHDVGKFEGEEFYRFIILPNDMKLQMSDGSKTMNVMASFINEEMKNITQKNRESEVHL